jgi:hypothetical protein
LSSEPNAPNTERTTEENRAENDADAGEEELSFQQAVGHWEEQQSTHKSMTLPVRDKNGEPVGEVLFRYRMLSEKERREAEQAAINVETSRNKEEVTTDSGALKNKLIEHGVVDGPEGFENKRAHRKAMPDHIKEPLADAIDSFSEMPEEVREGF